MSDVGPGAYTINVTHGHLDLSYISMICNLYDSADMSAISKHFDFCTYVVYTKLNGFL